MRTLERESQYVLTVHGQEAMEAIEEEREIIIGHSAGHRLLLVCFTAQGAAIRIFSARKATRRERRDYEENVSS
jgi:uncharacterized DUF497 family protein